MRSFSTQLLAGLWRSALMNRSWNWCSVPLTAHRDKASEYALRFRCLNVQLAIVSMTNRYAYEKREQFSSRRFNIDQYKKKNKKNEERNCTRMHTIAQNTIAPHFAPLNISKLGFSFLLQRLRVLTSLVLRRWKYYYFLFHFTLFIHLSCHNYSNTS